MPRPCNDWCRLDQWNYSANESFRKTLCSRTPPDRTRNAESWNACFETAKGLMTCLSVFHAILMPMNFSCHLDLPMNFACNLDAYELFVQSWLANELFVQSWCLWTFRAILTCLWTFRALLMPMNFSCNLDLPQLLRLNVLPNILKPAMADNSCEPSSCHWTNNTDLRKESNQTVQISL